MNEQFATSDLGTEPYLFWSAGAVSRVVKISGAVRVQVDVTRIEDVRGHVLARNARPVNSGTAAYAVQVSPAAAVQPFTSSYNLCGGSCCVDATTHTVPCPHPVLYPLARRHPWPGVTGRAVDQGGMVRARPLSVAHGCADCFEAADAR